MPVFPHEQFHKSFSGLFAPQLLQKLPTIPVFPQLQFHVSDVGTETGAGLLAPQLLQKLPVTALFPQVQSHVSGILILLLIELPRADA